MINEILLRRKHAVIIDFKEESAVFNTGTLAKLLTLELNLGSLGFHLSADLVKSLVKQPEEIIVNLYNFLIPQVKKLIGADKHYKVMYPNFPQQVAEATDAELWINAIFHYLSDSQWLPEYEKIERTPLSELIKRTEISIGNLADLKEIFVNLLSSKTSLSTQDYDDLKELLSIEESIEWFPEEIPFKETLAWISPIMVDSEMSSALAKYYHTATDVLRLAIAMSDGDVSMSSLTKFRSFKRRERRTIMNILAQCSCIKEDMWKNREQWLRLGERLHPGEFKSAQYKFVRLAFNSIRNDEKPLSWAGKIDVFLREKKTPTLIEMTNLLGTLVQRPGEFARRLDKILRTYPEFREITLTFFQSVADSVSTPVLLQMYYHFMERNKGNLRVVFPKGLMSKARLLDPFDNSLEDTDEIMRIILDALLNQYSERKPMGKVWIDNDLKNFIVPFSQRSANSAFKAMTRGSRFTLAKPCQRFFIWWTNLENGEQVDLDLSISFYTKDWKFIKHVSYTHLADAELKCFHSGDITDGEEFGGAGASEFIDIDLEQLVKKGVCYAVPQVYSFSGQSFVEVPCTFGWMGRSDLDSGEIYEPTTVQNQISLTSNSTISIPLIIDCEKQELIWADLANYMKNGVCNNLESNLVGTTAAAYAITNLHKADMHFVASLNAIARGKLVKDFNDADVIFTAHPKEIQESLANLEEEERTLFPELARSRDVRIISQWDLDVYMADII